MLLHSTVMLFTNLCFTLIEVSVNLSSKREPRGELEWWNQRGEISKLQFINTIPGSYNNDLTIRFGFIVFICNTKLAVQSPSRSRCIDDIELGSTFDQRRVSEIVHMIPH